MIIDMQYTLKDAQGEILITWRDYSMADAIEFLRNHVDNLQTRELFPGCVQVTDATGTHATLLEEMPLF
jgi:hypothetical protein